MTSTFIQASSSAVSVPGLIGSQWSALAATLENLGSTTITVAPRAHASAKSCITVLRVSSPMWLPISVRHSRPSQSTGSWPPTGRP